MKKLLLLITVITLTACTSNATKQNYRAANASNQLAITGDFNQLSGKINIAFDDDVVMSGNMPLLFGNDVELNGTHNDKPVSAYCNLKETVFSVNVQCLVFVNNERAVTLVF